MGIEKIRESFGGLLSSFVEGGILTEEVKNQFISELDQKLAETSSQESKTKEELEQELTNAIKEAADKIRNEYQEKFDALETEVASTPEESENALTIAKAFESFVASLPEENVKAFNEFTATLSDEQKELGKKFLDGIYDNEGIEATPDPKTEEDNKIDDVPETGEEDDELKELQDLAEERGIELTESHQIISALAEALVESGLGEIADGILNEAKASKITALAKKREKEYEKFLQQSVKQLARQNREMRLTGGVIGGARRIRNLDEVLVKLRKKLYLTETSNEDLNKQLIEANEKQLATEAENRELRERLKHHETETEKVLAENAELKKNGKLLTEAVETAKKEASIIEAKAFLTESVRDFSPAMRQHLESQFKGADLETVKSRLNEAVDAYREQRREERNSLRKNSTSQMSRTVNEAVENKKVDMNDDDQLARGFANLSESIVKK